MPKFQNAFFIALSFLLFTLGYIVSTGFYHIGELAIILTTSLILAVFYFKPQILAKTKLPADLNSLETLLVIIAAVTIALVGARLGDPSQTNWRFYSLINRVLAASALVLILSFFVDKLKIPFSRLRLPLLILVALAIRVFSIISAPSPTIDVFYILRDGPKLLLEGKNPYTLNFPAPYGVYIPTILFIYGPLVPFVFLPSVILFNDPRFMLVAADALSAFLIYKIAKRLKITESFRHLVIVIFLFHPLFPFMTEQAWLEPLMTLSLIAAVYSLSTGARQATAGLFLGAMLAIKSVYLLPLLTFLKTQKARLSQYLAFLLVPLFFSLPFLLSDASLFLSRTQSYVTNPQGIQTYLAPANVSLNISAVILKYTGFVLPTFVPLSLGLAMAFFVIMRRQEGLAFSLLALFLVFIVLFMFGPFVFLHYFAFLGNILLLVLLFFIAQIAKK